MTVDELHALYRAAHAEAWRVTQGGVLRAFEVSVNAAGLTVPERLMLELALHDATNGTPARPRDAFERALRQAAPLFAGLGAEAPGDRAPAWRDAA